MPATCAMAERFKRQNVFNVTIVCDIIKVAEAEDLRYFFAIYCLSVGLESDVLLIYF